MRRNKINNEGLFTPVSNDKFIKHIKTHSSQTLETIKLKIDLKNS